MENKAKILYTRSYAKLRVSQSFDLYSLNEAIRLEVKATNQTLMKQKGYGRELTQLRKILYNFCVVDSRHEIKLNSCSHFFAGGRTFAASFCTFLAMLHTHPRMFFAFFGAGITNICTNPAKMITVLTP